MKSKKIITTEVAILAVLALILTINSSFAQSNNKTDIVVDDERDVKNYSTTSKEAAAAMLEGTSKYGKYKVQLNWTADNTGKENVFAIHFLDAKTGKELPGVTYFIMLFKGETSLLDGTIRKNQTSPQQTYIIKDEGIYNLRLSSIDGSKEKIDFLIQIPLRQQ
ncbi:hypothetical protein [Candidatus Nitrosocosmicus arcticus]|uniref:hypothetical protein n=1 Tax=Candidatus Nitrosocosmicus arcticus TaxID=2035267 RepID=UPI00119F2A76|nr:hypothetical protein [Candidatus Nitrosocosmicus arcticus]